MFVIVGAWQLHRSAADVAVYGGKAEKRAQSATRLEAVAARTPDRTVEIVGIPERYRASDATAMLREGVSVGTLAGGASSLLAGCLGLLGAAQVARRSKTDRAALVDSFDRVRRMRPFLLGAQVAGLALALFCAVLFKAAGAWYLNTVSGGALYLAWLTLRDLAG